MADLYFPSVGLLLHADGANGSTTFTDSSSFARTVTAHASAQISTARSKWGGASGLFGSGDYLSVPNTGLYPTTQTEDFSVEAWVYLTAYPAAAGRLCGISNSGGDETWSFGVGSTGAAFFSVFDTSFHQGFTAAGTVPLNTWTHIAGVKSGNSVYAFADGTRGATVGTMTGTPLAPLSPLGIGRMGDFNGQYFIGNFDDLRITKGVARYTGSTYTVPTAAFPDVAEIVVSGWMASAFGTPGLRPAAIGWNAATFGTPHLLMEAAGWQASTFGTPALRPGAAGWNAASFGIPGLRPAAIGWKASTFGTPAARTGICRVQGWKAARFGSPIAPSNRTFAVHGWKAAKPGHPVAILYIP